MSRLPQDPAQADDDWTSEIDPDKVAQLAEDGDDAPASISDGAERDEPAIVAVLSTVDELKAVMVRWIP